MISHIDHLVLTVSDIERAVAFYSSVLNMEAITFGRGAGPCALATRRSICNCWGRSRATGRRWARGISASSPAGRWNRSSPSSIVTGWR